jgi:hypothetical protein
MRILYILVAVGLSGCRPSTNRPSDPKTSKPKKVNDDEKKPLNDDTEEIENSVDKENGDIPAPHVIQPSHHVPKLNPGHVIPPKDTAAPITKPNSGHVIEPKNPVPISKTFEAHTPDMPKSTPPKEGLFKEEITLESPKIEDGTKKKTTTDRIPYTRNIKQEIASTKGGDTPRTFSSNSCGKSRTKE